MKTMIQFEKALQTVLDSARRLGSERVELPVAVRFIAMYFKITDSAGCIGFISGRSRFFCQSCNRLRLTSDGKVRPCLYSAYSYDLKRLIRGGTNDRQVLNLLKRIIAEKKSFTKLNSFTEEFCMRDVGG